MSRVLARLAVVKPGEYQEFRVVMGPLPDTEQPLTAPSAEHGHGDVVPAADSTESRAATTTTTPPAWWVGVVIASVALIAALAAVLVTIRTTRRDEGGGSPG